MSTFELRQRCEARLRVILSNKDEGLYAKSYAEDVSALLDLLTELEEAGDVSSSKNVPVGLTFDPGEAARVVRAAWGIHHLLPHPDDEPTWAAPLREFHRSIQKLSKLP